MFFFFLVWFILNHVNISWHIWKLNVNITTVELELLNIHESCRKQLYLQYTEWQLSDADNIVGH